MEPEDLVVSLLIYSEPTHYKQEVDFWFLGHTCSDVPCCNHGSYDALLPLQLRKVYKGDRTFVTQESTTAWVQRHGNQVLFF